MEAAIYHYTDGSAIRPKVCQDQLDMLVALAESEGYSSSQIFCDKSLIRGEHTEFNRFLATCDQYDALVTKDLYHISKNTSKCFDIIDILHQRDVPVLTKDDKISISHDIPLQESCNIATYNSCFGHVNDVHKLIDVQNRILALFVSKKTNWTILDQYYDVESSQMNCDQLTLTNLIENHDKYDLILVNNLNDIHCRTAIFCKILTQLHLCIYSLQQDYLVSERSLDNELR